MPRPRQSLAQAHLSGALYKDPQRYKTRHEPLVTEPVGDPPDWLKPAAQAQWRELAATLPWLNMSHRGIVGIAAILAAKMADGTLGIPGMNLFRIVMGKLGATPESAAKVAMPSAEEADELLD
jgi:phage terminase small subunit